MISISRVIIVTMQRYYNIVDYIPHASHFILLLIYFITGSLCLLIFLTNFTHLPSSNPAPLATNYLFYASFSLYFRFHI